MRKLLLAALSLVFCFATPRAATEYVNGQWLDGATFVAKPMFVTNGKLTQARPRGEVRVIDLEGGYVVPPYADAHNHFPESEGTLTWAGGAFVDAGVFYVLNPNDIGVLANEIRSKLPIDVIFAHAGFTSTGSHPKALYEDLVDRKIYSYDKKALNGLAYYAVDSIDDVARVWPQFLATHPDLVKIYLLHSESPESNGGLKPEVAREVVRRAHRAGLRAGAHIESAADYHVAIDAGIDFVLHLPGYAQRKFPADAYLISAEDIAETVRRHVAVVTTAEILREPSDEMHAVQIRNLKNLKNAGVRILLGSDGPPGTGTVAEADYLANTHVFTNAELLQVWCKTARAIFPNRKVGELREGDEASFLVLRRNPIDDFRATHDIALRVKQEVIQPGGQPKFLPPRR